MKFRHVVALIAVGGLVSACESGEQRQARFRSAATNCLAEYASAVTKYEDASKRLTQFLADLRDRKDKGEPTADALEGDVLKIGEQLKSARDDEAKEQAALTARLDGLTKTSRIDDGEIDNATSCGAGAFIHMQALGDFQKIEEREKSRRESAANASELERINKIKGQLRAKAVREVSGADSYGAVKESYIMPDGNVVRCTTDLSGGRPTFWCDDGAESRYVKN